jgi:hypothetical protein
VLRNGSLLSRKQTSRDILCLSQSKDAGPSRRIRPAARVPRFCSISYNFRKSVDFSCFPRGKGLNQRIACSMCWAQAAERDVSVLLPVETPPNFTIGFSPSCRSRILTRGRCCSGTSGGA